MVPARALRVTYAELQVTTHFSFLRGASSAEELFAQAAMLGIPALGVETGWALRMSLAAASLYAGADPGGPASCAPPRPPASGRAYHPRHPRLDENIWQSLTPLRPVPAWRARCEGRHNPGTPRRDPRDRGRVRLGQKYGRAMHRAPRRCRHWRRSSLTERICVPLSRRQLRPYRRKVQIVFQDPFGSLNPRLTIGELIAQGPIVHGAEPEGALATARELLELVGLEPNAVDRYPHKFSTRRAATKDRHRARARTTAGGPDR